MYVISTNRKKNRLYIELKGFISYDETRRAVDAIKRELNNLKPDFDIINDMRDFKPTSPEGAMRIQQAQVYASQKGLRRVVRIVDSKLGSLQFKRLHQQSGIAYDVFEADSLVAAEKLLDELVDCNQADLSCFC